MKLNEINKYRAIQICAYQKLYNKKKKKIKILSLNTPKYSFDIDNLKF